MILVILKTMGKQLLCREIEKHIGSSFVHQEASFLSQLAMFQMYRRKRNRNFRGTGRYRLFSIDGIPPMSTLNLQRLPEASIVYSVTLYPD